MFIFARASSSSKSHKKDAEKNAIDRPDTGGVLAMQKDGKAKEKELYEALSFLPAANTFPGRKDENMDAETLTEENNSR